MVANNGQNGLPNGMSFPDEGANDAQGKRKTNPNSSANLNGMSNGQLAEHGDGPDPAVEGLNEIRQREISSKAVSGVLLVLLKWFKLSRKSCPGSLQRLSDVVQIYSNSSISRSCYWTLITYR